jgi:hypothetical protein
MFLFLEGNPFLFILTGLFDIETVPLLPPTVVKIDNIDRYNHKIIVSSKRG